VTNSELLKQGVPHSKEVEKKSLLMSTFEISGTATFRVLNEFLKHYQCIAHLRIGPVDGDLKWVHGN
jgi:hypothetical protein